MPEISRFSLPIRARSRRLSVSSLVSPGPRVPIPPPPATRPPACRDSDSPEPPLARRTLVPARTAGAAPAAAGYPSAGLPGQRLAPAAEPGQHVLQVGQLHLGLALPAAGVLGENVEDQRGPVDHLDLHHAFPPPQLAGGELAVADHGVRAGRRDDVG